MYVFQKGLKHRVKISKKQYKSTNNDTADNSMSTTLNERKKESYKIFDEIAGTYDGLNKFLSMGIDVYWRNQLLKNLPCKNNIKALDLACGTGDVPIVLAQSKYIDSIVGMDLSQEMINIGQNKIRKKNLTEKVKLNHGDATSLPQADSSIDLVTISFGIRNFSDSDKSLREINRVLTPGGRLLITELTVPQNFLIRMVYFFYFRFVLPTIGNTVSGHKDAYSYLNRTVEDYPCGKDFEKKMIKAGLINTSHTPLTFGIATLYIGEKSQ
jgi:demethylmenaquinone methyltransferase / 2-methoxy-6-polyprenyl-1,4-benzoquinol methylase